MIDLKELIKAGVYFGHQKSRWCPKMLPYIWGHRSGIHLIDVSKTALNLEKSAEFLKSIAEQGKPILWVGTKHAAQKAVNDIAVSLEMPYITHRWVGGLITNFSQVKKSVTKFLHFEDVLNKSEEFNYTKKELSKLQKSAEKLKRIVGGIKNLTWPIGAIVVVDAKKEETAIKEATQSGVPIVAIVDTNSDPSLINYVIPANDDSPKSIEIILNYLAKTIAQGKEKIKQTKLEEEEKEALETKEGISGIQELEQEVETQETGTGWKKPKKVRSVAKKIIKKDSE